MNNNKIIFSQELNQGNFSTFLSLNAKNKKAVELSKESCKKGLDVIDLLESYTCLGYDVIIEKWTKNKSYGNNLAEFNQVLRHDPLGDFIDLEPVNENAKEMYEYALRKKRDLLEVIQEQFSFGPKVQINELVIESRSA